ncbi:MAG: apolipoprotein N-acyltransferase [Crocinitomicaceae bacterium]
MAASFPATGGLFPLIFIAFAPVIWFNIDINSTEKWRFLKRFVGNYLFAITFNVAATWWIKNASLEGALMAFLANSLLMTFPFFFFGFFTRILGRTKGIISLIVLWISFEHIHHQWDLSWPWLSFGNAFGSQPWLIQWYEYSGIQGGTLWVLIVNVLIFFILRNILIRKEKLSIQTPIFIGLVLTVTVPVLSSVFIYSTYKEEINPFKITIVQPNLNPWNSDFTGPGVKFTTSTSSQIERMLDMVDEKVDDNTGFVLFPETALSSYMDEAVLDNLGVIYKLRKFSRSKASVPIFIGADTYGLFKTKRPFPAIKKSTYWIENYNTALLIDTDKPIDVYHKSKLVLGVEKLPFVDFLPFLAKWSVSLGGTAGILVENKDPKNFAPKGVKSAPLICYESVYGEYVTQFTKMGAELLCVITNDGWWGDTPGYKQHLTFSQIRAIENRRSLARSANTGISCFINQRGDIEQMLDWNVEGVISQEINRNLEITFYVRYGDLLGRISEFLLIGIFLMAISNHIRRKKQISKET